MSMDIQATRALTYHGSFCVDLENGALRKIEFGNIEDKAEKKALRQESRKYGRYNKLLTPMSKYYASEMSMRVANDAMAVLGGSGYMKDYPVERYLRDSRITTIYEGTSQLQVVAAIAGVVSGMARTVIEELIDRSWPEDIAPMIEQIRSGLELMEKGVEYVKGQAGTAYRDLCARKLVDVAIYLVVAALFCDQATGKEAKKTTAAYWLSWRMPEIRMLIEQVCSGDQYVITDSEALLTSAAEAE